MSTTVDINKLFQLIDSYKYASVRGEKVELIVTPYMVDDKWDDSKRLITIGLQGGLVRDRETFLVNSSNVFDDIVLPQLLSYFTHGDSLLKWDIVESSIESATHKGVIETETGNVFYLETFNKDLFEEVVKDKKSVDKDIVYKDDFLTDNDKIWNEIIYYASKRRTLQDFYTRNDLSTRDRENILKFVAIVADNKRGISGGTSKIDLIKNQKFMDELFKDKKKLIELGLSDRLINKISDEAFINELGILVGAEKRIRRKLDINNPTIKSKIEFAINELEKVDYYSLKNASAIDFANGKFTSNQPAKLYELKQLYSVDRSYSKSTIDDYKKYCDEVLTYLENKALNNKKISKSKIKTPLTVFEKYEDRIVDDYNKFYEIIDLVTKGRIDLEKYEIIVEPSVIDPTARNVRVSIVDGVSRNDTYYFFFTDGESFDEIFAGITYELNKNDPTFKSVISTNYDENKQLIRRDVLRETQKRNEILIKNANESLALRKSVGLIDKFKKIKEELIKQSKKRVDNKNASDIISKLKDIEKEISVDAKRQDELLQRVGIVDDSTVDFDQLHHYAVKYKLGEVNKKLAIYDRDKGMAYNPPLESEKRNIEFAIYWSVMTGLAESNDDVVFGEKYAFSEDNRILFNIMDVQFKESLRKGIPVDMDSLKKQFLESGVPNSERIFDRLFKNDHYVDYVRLYYKKSLNSLKDSIKRSANDQARELISKRERAENMSSSSNEKKRKLFKEPMVVKQEASDFAEHVETIENVEVLRREAKEFAKKIMKANELATIEFEAKNFASAIQNESELAILKKEAKEFAKYIEQQIEQEQLKKDAETLAKKINEQNEIEVLLVEADKCAHDLQLANERSEIIGAAKANAERIVIDGAAQEAAEHLFYENAGKEQAQKLAFERAGEKQALRLLYDEAGKEQGQKLAYAQAGEEQGQKLAYAQAGEEQAQKLAYAQAGEEQAQQLAYAQAGEEQAQQLAYAQAGEEQAQQLAYAQAGEEQAQKLAYAQAGEEQAQQLFYGAAGEEQAQKIYYGAAGEEQARELIGMQEFGREISEINKLAEQYANDIFIKDAANQCAEDIFYKASGEEQAKMLVGAKEKEDSKAAKLEKKNSLSSDKPKTQDLIDAYDVVESLATNDQPLSVKVFFPKEKGGNIAEVILSNGIGADETVMYCKDFDVEVLKSDIIPLLCDLYSRDNEIIYNHQLGVPNAKKSGLAVVGKEFKTFQVSNADSDFVNFCQNALVDSFDNSKNMSKVV